ncbi:uncharacterized protein LOC125661109 [Ostrea edulis]|uniref:uncharacterized protein LOC125661109 n=1 Tax=Ostrea edulis TaxID=37623 RepID=UPI0024AEED86|nr:uncharacterized protein LOC125661109 [Ostrea edulis]
MQCLFVSLLLFVPLFGTCEGQCSLTLPSPFPPGPKGPTHCTQDGVEVALGTSYTNKTTCISCKCHKNGALSCCNLLGTYFLPDDCVVVTEDCKQRAIYKSDGSPCQPTAIMGRK